MRGEAFEALAKRLRLIDLVQISARCNSDFYDFAFRTLPGVFLRDIPMLITSRSKSIWSVRKRRMAALLVLYVASAALRAEILHEYDVGAAGNSAARWSDTFGDRNLNKAGADGSVRVVFVDDSRTAFSRAYAADRANLNAGAGSGLATASYTFELWLLFGAGPQAGQVIMETGGGVNGLGLYTRADGLELATSSVTTGADALALISLKNLDTTHFIQVVATVDTTTRTVRLRARDVHGQMADNASVSAAPLFLGTANGMGLFAGGNGNYSNAPGDIGGSQATGSTLPNSPSVFSGSIALFRIYEGIALKEVDESYGRLVLPPSRSADPKPNFIVIFTDDQGYADVTAQRQDPDVSTPHIDTLAAEGIRFTDGYITAPQCVPSRAGIVAGRYQQRFGVEQNGQGPLPLEVFTIPERLRQAGYRTGMVGKWHLEPNQTDREWAAENGFDPKDIPESEKRKYLPGEQGFEEFAVGNLNTYWANFRRDGRDGLPLGAKQTEDGHRIDVQSDFAVSFIQRNHDRPFFLYLGHFAPHVPLQWVERYRNTFNPALPEKRRIALGMIKAMDDGVGRILAQLKQYDIDDKTVVWFISDNGAPLGYQEDGNVGASDASVAWDGSLNTPWLGEKGMLSEGGIRVPWLMRWKGTLQPRVYSEPVISLDVGATATALAGLAIDAALDGVNLMPHLSGAVSQGPHENLYWRFWNQSAVRSGRWKYIELAGVTPALLFDLESDRHEQANIIGQYPLVAEVLAQRLAGWETDVMARPTASQLNGQETPWYRHSFGVGIATYDSDGDGAGNSNDAFPYDPTEKVDTDGDGIGNNADSDDDGDDMPDAFEIANGLDPQNPADAQLDSDKDDLSNLEEYRLNTNIQNPDTDGDGRTDGAEVFAGRNPLRKDNALTPAINLLLQAD